MREIKFRGHSIYEDKWVYGGVHIVGDDAMILAVRPGNLIFHAPVDPKSVGEFTGLHDKDGKEIYEGDRLMCTVNDEPIGEIDRVQFKDGEFRLANRDRSLRSWLYTEELYGKEVECNFYLAGNIFEHPDLLK